MKIDFFVVGMPKSGTTALHAVLKKHPGIFLPDVKEPGFFARETASFLEIKGEKKPKHFIHDKNAYFSLYKKAGQRKKGDMTTKYCISRQAPFEIKEHNPKAKIIIILREPLSFLKSMINWRLALGGERFERYDLAYYDQYVHNKGIHNGGILPQSAGDLDAFLHYDLFIERYFHTFGKKNVLVLFYEDLVKDFDKTCTNIFSFIGVDTKFKVKNVRKNVSKKPPSWILTLRKTKILSIIPSFIRLKLGAFFLQQFSKELPKKEFPKPLEKMILFEQEEMLSNVSKLLGIDVKKKWYSSKTKNKK